MRLPTTVTIALLAASPVWALTNAELGQQLQAVLPAGHYEGRSEDGRECRAQISHGELRDKADFIASVEVPAQGGRERLHGNFQLTSHAFTTIKRVARLTDLETEVVINRREASGIGAWHPNHDETLIARRLPDGTLELDLRNRKLLGRDEKSPSCVGLRLVRDGSEAPDESGH